MGNVYGYVRVSSKDQNKDRQVIRNHINLKFGSSLSVYLMSAKCLSVKAHIRGRGVLGFMTRIL